MATFQIKQGRDIKLKGAAPKEIVTLSLPRQVAVVPSDFKGIKASLCVKVNDAVKVGTPLFEDKHCPEIRIVSPVSGRVAAIDRGEKRFLEDIVVESDGRDEAVAFRKFSASEISGLSKEDVEKTLLQSGLWPVLRQRPFSKVAHPHEPPKSIFVHAMNTEPLAPDVDFILQGKEEQFQAGLNVLRRLTKGKVYLCAKHGSRSKALTQARDVETHYFAGPHPAGNVSTHIHYLDPIHKGDHVWYVEAQDVARAQPGWLHARVGEQQVPQGAHFGRADEQFVAELAGIAGAADQHFLAQQREMPELEILELVERRPELRAQHLARQRALQIDFPGLRRKIGQLPAAAPPLEYREIIGCGGGVDDDEKTVGGEPEDDEVVDHPAAVVEQEPVLAAPDGYFRHGQGQRGVEAAGDRVAGEQKFAHMADVEQRDLLAAMPVLGDDAAVVDGHIPAAELRHAGAGRQVIVM